ncbi:hypothetical protein E3Q19_02991 [Wallemia mellicola]|nr:hypothetical protein E3Q19_02991 [Wallemia mellicola]
MAENEKTAIRINLPERAFPIVFCGTLVGFSLGSYRGGRIAGKKFLAENAHRAPKTVQGWYFYNKTKNYRIMQRSLTTGLLDASKIGGIALVWVAASSYTERLRKNIGVDSVYYKPLDELAGAISTVTATSILYKLPKPIVKRLASIAIPSSLLMSTLIIFKQIL